MPANGRAIYLDSSAIVKLVVRERESDHLLHFIADHRFHISCDLAVVEVIRAVRPQGPLAISRGHEVLGRLHLQHITLNLLMRAARLEPTFLRSLDAIHLAAAQEANDVLDTIVTYDHRMADAARNLGFAVETPGRL